MNSAPTAPTVGPRLRDGELGPERFCLGCGEGWPLDEEFFYHDQKSPTGLASRCRACWADWKVARDMRRQHAQEARK